eukprot:scaffold650_cov249-Pinguiococcus_pyrenoidosus.AAC.19
MHSRPSSSRVLWRRACLPMRNATSPCRFSCTMLMAGLQCFPSARMMIARRSWGCRRSASWRSAHCTRTLARPPAGVPDRKREAPADVVGAPGAAGACKPCPNCVLGGRGNGRAPADVVGAPGAAGACKPCPNCVLGGGGNGAAPADVVGAPGGVEYNAGA